MQEIGLRFYFGGVSDSGQLFVHCLTFCSQRWTEWMEGKDKKWKKFTKDIVPTMDGITHAHTGLWIDLAFYSPATDRQRESQAATKTFCVINKTEKRFRLNSLSSCTIFALSISRMCVFFTNLPQSCAGVIMQHEYFSLVIVILFSTSTLPANQVY